jgi:hypothetical protein
VERNARPAPVRKVLVGGPGLRQMAGDGDRVAVDPWHISADEVRDLVASLNHLCFHAGADRFGEEFSLPKNPTKLAQEHLEAMPDFLRWLNWSLKRAQRCIIDVRLRLEATRRAGSLEIDDPYTFEYLIRLLTDYADSIAWGLLEYDLSWVRSQFLQPTSHSDLVDHNWESIEQVLSHFNEDPDQFMFATDLTSFMHVGDVFLRNATSRQTMTIEVKSGAANERVGEILSSPSPEEFAERLDAFVAASSKPEHAIKQVDRNLKQRIRMAKAGSYRDSGNEERIDLSTDQTVIVFESETDDRWFDAVAAFAKNLGEFDAAGGVIDECLFFEYGTGPCTPQRNLFFRHRLSRHLGLSLSEAELKALPVFDVARTLSLPCFVPQSTSLLALGEDRQSRLLALDDHLLVYLDVPLLKEMLAKYGIKLQLRNTTIEQQPFVDPLTRVVFGPNKTPFLIRDQPDVQLSVAGGITGRILFNFMSPFALVDLLATFVAETVGDGVSAKPK